MRDEKGRKLYERTCGVCGKTETVYFIRKERTARYCRRCWGKTLGKRNKTSA